MEIKEIIEKHFDFVVKDAQLIGEGFDSKAYLVNGQYIFKIKYSANQKKGYQKEKAVYDFLNRHMKCDIKIPNVEYSLITGDESILGYKEIKGEFLSPKLYAAMMEEQKTALAKDIAAFLREMHSLDYSEISQYKIDNKQNVLEEYQLLKDTVYDKLTPKEQEYIEKFMSKLHKTEIFDGKKCLCHNDFSCNHILVDEKGEFTGVIDFGDAGIIEECCDFLCLVEESGEELGREFGERVLEFYGDIDKKWVFDYQDMTESYYPIQTIVYGVKNNRQDKIEEGRKLIAQYSEIY